MGDLRRFEENEADDVGSPVYNPPYSTKQVELANKALWTANQLIDALNAASAAGVKFELSFNTLEAMTMGQHGPDIRWKADIRAYVPIKL